MAEPSPLSHLVELDALDLEDLEPLAHDHVAAEEYPVVPRRKSSFRVSPARDDADVARQEPDRGPGLRARS